MLVTKQVVLLVQTTACIRQKATSNMTSNWKSTMYCICCAWYLVWLQHSSNRKNSRGQSQMVRLVLYMQTVWLSIHRTQGQQGWLCSCCWQPVVIPKDRRPKNGRLLLILKANSKVASCFSSKSWQQLAREPRQVNYCIGWNTPCLFKKCHIKYCTKY